MTALIVDLNAVLTLDNEQFYQLCRANPDLQLERNVTGEIVIMSPTGGDTGNRNFELGADLAIWNRRTRLGYGFDSSTGFTLPNGATRAPDVAWVEKSRWERLPPEQRRKFPAIAPDFVLELVSPSDRLDAVQTKLKEYMANGVRLGWVIDPQTRRVEIYRSGQAVEVLTAPAQLLGETVLPGFILDVSYLWSQSG
ncbi:MAG: Uma2 family endonuclease [Spirulinaceae cyanobacterium]